MTGQRKYRTPRVETRADAVRRACARRGITIIETETGTYRLVADGVYILATKLGAVELRDLRPHHVTWAGTEEPI